LIVIALKQDVLDSRSSHEGLPHPHC